MEQFGFQQVERPPVGFEELHFDVIYLVAVEKNWIRQKQNKTNKKIALKICV